MKIRFSGDGPFAWPLRCCLTEIYAEQLIIEDPSTTETGHYLRSFARVGEDKNVLPPSDKNVRPLKKPKREEDKLVNEEQALKSQRATMTRHLHPDAKAKREYVAQEIMSVVHDEKSLGFYRSIAERLEPHHIFEALSEVRLAAREGRIKTSRGAYFTSLVKRVPMYSSTNLTNRGRQAHGT